MLKKILGLSLKLSLVGFTLLAAAGASADEGHRHSETVCSAKSAAICAHLGMPKAIKTTEEAQFIAHVEIANEALVTNMAVALWMPEMGHGSSPVELKDAGKNHYIVSKAYFTMPGTWLVKLSFEFEGVQHNIDIPVEIAE
ncbi:MAG: FixH family protein [Bdellovibrionaceae bacterium]|nr:FixH family protein [Pseudobdellovibrionaceae bacterium]